MRNELIWTFAIFFIFIFLNRMIRQIMFSIKLKKRFRDELDEVINSDRYKVRGKNEQGLL